MFITDNQILKQTRGKGIFGSSDNQSPRFHSGRRPNSLVVISGLLLCLAGAGVSTARAQNPVFGEQIVFSGLIEPTAVQFAPDNRVFVAEKSGLIKVFDDLSDTTETVFADLRQNVYAGGANGLLSIVLDPAFPAKPFLYVLYTYNGGTANPCPQAPNACVLTARLSRLQGNGNVMTGTEQILISDWRQHYPGQPAGGLAFGPDGGLYVSAGDGASSAFVDSGQSDSPSLDPSNEGGALRSQDLRTPADTVTLSGTLVRVHPDTGAPLPQTTSMTVGAPTVDPNGVKSYSVVSQYHGNQSTVVRVLEPENPTPGKLHRILYVLPVAEGLTDLSSTSGDGLEELRLLNAHNRYNLTLIAPSFNISPWYGDHASDPSRRLESFIVRDLLPFGNSLFPEQIPQTWVLGFSKSGTGTLSLILRNPNAFSAAAAWDAPAQFTDMSAFQGMVENFGTEENFDRYEIPPLVIKSAAAFRSRNRMWISGDQSAWTSHMIQLHEQQTQAGVLHTWVEGGFRAHHWSSGWLEGALASLDQNGTLDNPVDTNAQRIIAYGLRNPSRFAFRPGTSEVWVAEKGWNDWEEINRVGMATDGALENFGWPCYEGGGTTAYAGLALCSQLYTESAAATPPVYAYHHSQQVVSGESCAAGTGEISGLAFYTSGPYPSNFQDALFFSDRSRGCVWAMFRGSNGAPDPASRATVAPGAASPVDLKIGPGGFLYYVDSDGGTVRRISSLAGTVDSTAPVRSDGSPSGTLSSGTTQTVVSLQTNENAVCRYATAAGVAYTAMTNTFTTTGGQGHSTTVTGLTNGTSYSYFVRCQDQAGNANPDDFTIIFSVAADTAPPVRTSGSPSGTLKAGTTQTTLQLTTNESATCRYSTVAGVAYASMTKAFGTTGGLQHSTQITGLENGTNYSFYVRCQDGNGNANTNDFTINFKVGGKKRR